MKLLLCPKGYIGITVKNIRVRIDKVGTEERGYALVRDDIANELIKKEGFEIVDPSSYPRDINNLYSVARQTLGSEKLEDLLEPSENYSTSSIATEKEVYDSETNIPNPVFIPTIWTDANNENWPVTLTYSDSNGEANTFVFTKEYTLGSCSWCRLKYWLRSKFRRKNKK